MMNPPDSSPELFRKSILVTGATGFIGRYLLPVLADTGYIIRAATRRPISLLPLASTQHIVDPSNPMDWQRALQGSNPELPIGTVIHLAGRAHVMHDDRKSAERAFEEANVNVTNALARQAGSLGVSRFIFVSSIKALGESTEDRPPLQPTDVPAPEDAYGRSKLAAERSLAQIGQETGMEIVIVRPPLVYGPGVKGNLATLLTWMQRGYPLPLGALPDARRSMVNVRNLVDLLVTLIDHPAAAGETFHVRDDEDVTTRDLLLRLYAGLGRSPRLIPVPLPILRAATRLVGQEGMLDRLATPLQVDDSMTRARLNWSPRWTLDEGIRDMVEASPMDAKDDA